MENLKSYAESINEAAGNKLPAIPAALKKAGAKEDYVHLGGPPKKDQGPNAWIIDIPNPFGSKFAEDSKKYSLIFFPDKHWHLRVFSPVLGMKSIYNFGTWTEGGTEPVNVLGKSISGITLKVTSLVAPRMNTLD